MRFKNFFVKKNPNILFLILLIVILLANLFIAGFLLAKTSQIERELQSLNQQLIMTNNANEELGTKINNLQSLMMRLQSYFYRANSQTGQE